jgi:hypothetical protein
VLMVPGQRHKKERKKETSLMGRRHATCLPALATTTSTEHAEGRGQHPSFLTRSRTSCKQHDVTYHDCVLLQRRRGSVCPAGGVTKHQDHHKSPHLTLPASFTDDQSVVMRSRFPHTRTNSSFRAIRGRWLDSTRADRHTHRPYTTPV